MSRFFGRNYHLEITTTSGEVLRYEPPIETRFLVDNFPQHANATAGITVFGISSRVRELIQLRDDAKNNYGTVILKAGYGDDTGVIFTGSINNVQVAKDGVDTCIKLYCSASSTEWDASFHELPEGTEGLIHFSQRSVDYWIEQGGPVRPLDARMFDATDAFFAPGYRSRATRISGLPNEGIGMSNASGSVRLHLSDGGINLKVGSQTLSLSSDGLTHNGKNIGSTHKHGGVEKGGSTTKEPE